MEYVKIITGICPKIYPSYGAYLALIWILMNGNMTCGTVLQLFPPIHTTLENAVMVTMLHQLFPTQTASSLDVLCVRVPTMQPRVATTVIQKTLMSTCFSSFERHWCRPFFFDGASQGSRRGSHVHEINTLLWNFGRPHPRVGGLLVAKTEKMIRRHSRSETSRRAWKTRQAGKRAADDSEEESS